MRRSDRAVTDHTRQLDILNQCKILRIAMMDAEGLYIVPVSFGYVEQEGKLSFYLHSATEGRKVSAMSAGCAVAFELDCQFQLQEGEIACEYSCAYASIIGAGHAALVEDPIERAAGLAAVMKHQTGKAFTFTEELPMPVAIFRIDVEQMSVKQKH